MQRLSFKTQVTATLHVRQWVKAIEFYQRAFGARLVYQVPGGGVGRLLVPGVGGDDRGAEF